MSNEKITEEIKVDLANGRLPLFRVHDGKVMGGAHTAFLGKVKGHEIYEVDGHPVAFKVS